MPSTKSPTSLQVGPGRIPSNVVTSSALTSLPGISPTASTPPLSVASVSSTTALTRSGQHMLVIVDNSGGALTVTLPTDAQIGDLITLVVKTTSANLVTVARGGSDSIHGFATSEVLTGIYESRTFVRVTASEWVTSSDKPSVQTVTATGTPLRSGPSLIVLVDATSGTIVLTLPVRAQVGDRITFVKHVASANSIQVDPSGVDTIDGRASTQIVTTGQALSVVRVSASAWITVSETSSVHEVTDTFSLSGLDSAKEIHVLVRTSNGAWVAGTKTITLPSTVQTRPGQVVTISDVDGNAEAANITIAGQVLGTVPTGTSSLTLTRNYAAVTLQNKSSGNWTIQSEDRGLVSNFFALSRSDSRSDVSQSRFDALPMFNWSHRKVALHAEFHGLITNILPVEGFSAGGNLTLTSTAGVAGTVGLLRCSVVTGSSGYLHLGDTPTSALFNPGQLQGFRAILRLNTASPGSSYDFAIGFGDDISDVTGNIGSGTDTLLGANGLWLGTGPSGSWRRVRRSASTSAGGDLSAITAGNRYVIEYNFDGTNWDGYVNGVRHVGGSTSIPSAGLNFGLVLIDGGSVTPTVDIDSITIFTRDLGATRFT